MSQPWITVTRHQHGTRNDVWVPGLRRCWRCRELHGVWLSLWVCVCVCVRVCVYVDSEAPGGNPHPGPELLNCKCVSGRNLRNLNSLYSDM